MRRTGSSTPVETRNGEYVSGDFFETLGISAWRGRLFTDVDDQEGAPPVAVMSFRIWRGKYGSDPSVAGGTYEINGHPFTVVGVAPPGFFGAKMDSEGMPDFWLPLTTEPLIAGPTSRLKNPRLAWLDLIGRVRPGTNPKILETQLQVELQQWLASHLPDMTSSEKTLLQRQTLRLTPGGAGVSRMRQKYKDGLLLLLLAAACVLLVACANVANLLLARGLKYRQQTAIRVTLGAPRSRLVRKALIESLGLAVIGGAAGIAVAYAGAGLILRLAFGRPDYMGPRGRHSFQPRAVLRAGNFGDHWTHLRCCAGMDDLARGPNGSDARSQPHGGIQSRRSWKRRGAEDAGDRAGGGIADATECGGDARPEPAQSGAPEFWIR